MSAPKDDPEPGTDKTVRPINEQVEEHEQEQRRRRRGVFLLPNLITSGALFAGFYSIISATSGSLEKAAIAIFIAGMLDMLDGRIARMTNTQSDFGIQYDSLADLVAFGVAPAVLGFSFCLRDLGNFGWMVTFMYMACAALRLARFNTHPNASTFTGLASPPSAGVVAGIVWVWFDMGLPADGISTQFAVFYALVTAGAALLMVSNISYVSPKSINTNRVPFRYMLGSVLLFVFIFLYPPGILFAMSVAYVASGPVQALLRMKDRGELADLDAAEEGTESDKKSA